VDTPLKASISHVTPQLTAPCLLVASPELIDPNFRKTVILLCQHSLEGSLGFIVNRPLEIELGRLLEDTEGLEHLARDPVYMGGPVHVNSGTILYKGNNHDDDSVEIAQNFYMTGSLERLKSIHEPTMPRPYRFLLGYAGWGGGQLDWEIRQHSWLVSTMDVEFILTTPANEIWDRTMNRMGIDACHLITPETSLIN